MDSYVNHVLFAAQEWYCPMEQLFGRTNRYHFASARLVQLCRMKAKEFRPHRYIDRFKQLKKECMAEIKKFQQKCIEEVVQAAISTNSWLGRLEELLDP